VPPRRLPVRLRFERLAAAEATREEKLVAVGDGVVGDATSSVVYLVLVCRAGRWKVILAMLVMSRMKFGAKGSVDSADLMRVEREPPPAWDGMGTGT
jgi:hypothetical protein